MKRHAFLLAITLGLAACGGGGGNSPGSDSSRGDQLASDRILTAQSIEFPAKIVPESLASETPLRFTGVVWNPYQHSHLISTLDQLNNFNELVGQENQFTVSDLATHAYFLILKSDCASDSEITGIKHGPGQVTVKLNRSAPAKAVSCTTADSSSFYVFKAKKVHAPEILFETLVYSTQPSIPTAGNTVIHNADEWAALWAEHFQPLNAQMPTAAPPLPAVDFSKNMLVSVYAGPSPNGCHGVNIDRIYPSSDQSITVEYAKLVPAAGDICTQAFIYPWQVVLVPRSSGSFQFVETVRD